MDTAISLSKLQIPDYTSDPASLSPAVPSSGVPLPSLSPVGEENQSDPGEITAIGEDSTAPFLSAAVSPTYVDSHFPPTVRAYMASPAFQSRTTSASSMEMLVSGPASSPLLGEELGYDPTRAGRSSYKDIFSPRSFRSLSSSSSVVSARSSTPPSATILSASQLRPPLQIGALRPRRRSTSGSTTAVPPTPAPRPRHDLYYLTDEMAVFEVSGNLIVFEGS